MPSVARGFHRLLEDEHRRLEAALGALEVALCAGDTVTAGAQLATFEVGLTRCVRGEETLLFPVLERSVTTRFAPTAKMRQEHLELWKLATAIWDAMARADRPRALEVLGRLRSVFVLHVAKEEWSIYPLLVDAVPPTTEAAFLLSLTTE
jgi:iron-sulfur cluster repair protein YtfE (RIC family)